MRSKENIRRAAKFRRCRDSKARASSSKLARTFRTIRKGALVILPHNIGTWREAVAVKAMNLLQFRRKSSRRNAAMLKINPMTAWRLLHDYVDLSRGDWVDSKRRELGGWPRRDSDCARARIQDSQCRSTRRS